MRRRRRTEILVQANPNLAASLANEIKQTYTYKEIVAPRHGLTMVKMRESAQKSLFYIGEVLVTEAKVEIQGEIGIGIIQGMHDEVAMQLAIIDAAYNAQLPETLSWTDTLEAAEAEINRKRIRQQAELMETKVNFETMDV